MELTCGTDVWCSCGLLVVVLQQLDELACSLWELTCVCVFAPPAPQAVMEAGKLAEFAPPNELLRDLPDGLFSQLVRAQAESREQQ